jgi:hypothetical protein
MLTGSISSIAAELKFRDVADDHKAVLLKKPQLTVIALASVAAKGDSM